MSFESKSAVITGGARGIGFETARDLLRNGLSNIAILDILDVKGSVLELKREFADRTVLGIKTDVTNRSEIEKAFKEIFQIFNRIDIVIANAGVFDESKIELTVNVNLLGVIYTNFIAIQYMSKKNGGEGGTIVNISSICGLDYVFSSPVYNATKHGVVGFTRSMADEYYHNENGISFISICPIGTDTPILHNMRDKVLYRDSYKQTRMALRNVKMQTAEVAGQNIRKLISIAGNGSIWILEDGKYRETTLKVHSVL